MRAKRVPRGRVRILAKHVRDRWVRLTENVSLEGHCEEVSHALVRALQRAGLSARVVYGLYLYERSAGHRSGYHFWVEVAGEILDCTATQFEDVPAVWYPADPKRFEELRCAP